MLQKSGGKKTVDMVNIPSFTGFYTSQVGIKGFVKHQQYDGIISGTSYE